MMTPFMTTLFDWLGNEGWIILNWWLLVSAAGLTALPALLRLLGNLPDRGYTLARPAGLLMIAFVFWFLAVLGFVDNSAGSMLLAWMIVLIASVSIYLSSGDTFNPRAWWRDNRGTIITSELLFVVLFIGWALYRAYQNDLTTTEKPMDLAFMSASQRSAGMPPDDPWLAGYAISYYYFGYVMGAMLSTLSGIWSTIGYNINLALLFALSGTTTYGIVANLVRSRAHSQPSSEPADTENKKRPSQLTASLVGLLAAFFVVLMGNFYTPLVEMPYQSGASQSYLDIWDVNQRRTPLPAEAVRENPTQWGHWWWFRAARTISDRQPEALGSGHIEVIAEFPQFSFILGDSHPHVMALPYALLCIGLALNIILGRRRPDPAQIIFYGLCVGALVFLNTWDNPVYLFVLVGAEAVRRLIRTRHLTNEDWFYLFTFGGALLAITLVAYSPFLIGFRSQLGGILPNILHPTHTPQLFLMFGPFFLLLAAFLSVEIWRGNQQNLMNWKLGGSAAVGIFLVLIALLLLMALFAWISPVIRQSVLGYVDQSGGWDALLPEALGRRFAALGTLLILLIGLGVVTARLFPPPAAESQDAPSSAPYPTATGFTLLLIGAALGLVLIPEFVYLRDNFGTRMNTVFKFYYQAWIMFSIASAYGVYTLLADRDLPHPALPIRAAFSGLLALIIVGGAMYPVLAAHNRAIIETGRNIAPRLLTLDGGPGFVNASDYEVIMCLRELVGDGHAIVAEADPTRSSSVNYNPYHGRVGSLTGIPVIMGWPGHQRQWRGTGYAAAAGTRLSDMRTLYEDLRIDAVIPIIERYGITHIMYGTTERQNSGAAGEDKFREHFEVVCESGNSRIYRVSPITLGNR